jgi:tRNA G18 (ribose-2'-O)-methylase SpoU
VQFVEDRVAPPSRAYLKLWSCSRSWASGPFALVFGNEEEGLRPATLKLYDEIVTIPRSVSVRSLNVAATAGILIYVMAPELDRG